MRLYDFSVYANRRKAAQAVQQIRALVPHLNDPGVVLEFKRQVEGWLILHDQVEQFLQARK